jgi:pimeloyl-ACP methyl ester carboxylesterase/phosphohistidine swiveling domain-containing protein
MITLVAVHGNGGGGFRFARVEPHVPDGIRFEAVTLPGFGGRPGDPSLHTLPDYAEALWREIEHLPRPIVVLGHGIGGSIALDMVQRHEVDALMLHAPVGTRLEKRWFPRLMKPEPVRSLIKWGISSRLTRPLVGRRFFSRDVPVDYRNQFLDEYGRADSFSQMFDIITPEWWEGLTPVDMPALMLWGSDDRVLGADQVADYRALLPQTWVDVVPGWGHFPMVEGPAEYAATIADWAERLVAGRPAPLRVGSGLLAAEGVGPKAALLDRAVAAGLRVPPAFVLLPGAAAEVPDGWTGRVAVRSAFSSEDGATTSNAGRYTTVLDVDADDPNAMSAAVRDVRMSVDTSVARADVMVMQMVPAVVAGVAFSEAGWQDDLVEWVDGLADGLVGGSRAGELIDVARLIGGEHLDTQRPAWQTRLAELLRAVRGEFGDERWDIEWADDGSRCWLVQLRPITASPLRNETFTIANHREILPDPPSVFMTSLIADGSPELFDYYRRFDPSLPSDRDFIEVFDGRPLLNLSLMIDFMRSLGLPTRLVTDSIGGSDEHGAGLRPGRIVRRLPVLARLGWAQASALRFADHARAMLAADNAAPTATFAEAVDRATGNYVTTVHAMTALNTASSLPTSLLRSLGVLEEHAARNETAATRMFRELDAVRSTLPKATMDTSDPIDPEAFGPATTAAWARWMSDHGHRGIYESDYARARYVEEPAPILVSLRSARPPRSTPRRSARGVVTVPLWLAARRPMNAREEFRSDSMRSFLAVRRELLRHADSAGIDPAALWLLETDEVRRLDDGWRPDETLLAERRVDGERRRANPIPEVIRRFDPPVSDPVAVDGSRTRFHGVGLVAATAEGRAWVLNEPAHELPDGFDPATTILVAPSVDPGWMATFGLVAGVAIELGGDLSHGSIVLRELGLAAVTNARGLTASITTGDRVRVDGRRGVVQLVR